MVLFPGCKCCGGGGAGPFKCYTNGTDYQCVGANETPPSGWTTNGVEHANLADCEAVCGGGGGPGGNPCDCPENKALAAKVEFFDAVFDSIPPGSSATPEQITAGLAIANATQYTLTAGTGFVWIPDITMPNITDRADCATRPGQDVGGGNIVLIDGTGELNAECTGKLFGAVATLKSYYTKAEWDNFCGGAGVPPGSLYRLVMTFDPVDGVGGGSAAITDSWHSCGSPDKVFEHLTVRGAIQQNFPERYGFVFNCKVRVTFSGNPLP